jgi:hypothetical protein
MSWAASLMAVVMVGCADVPPARPVYQDTLTLIELRTDAKAGREHSHPTTLTPEQVGVVLSGIRVRRRGEPVYSTIVGGPHALPAFSAADVYALAKPISQALALASPKELVTFYRRISDAQIRLGFTTGGVFVERGLLYVILANHRASPKDAAVRDVPTYDADPINDPLGSLGTTTYTLTYTRPEAEVPVQASGRYDRAKMLVVDPILAQRTAPSAPTSSHP